MKQRIQYIFLCFLFLLIACNEEHMDGEKGEGWLSVEFLTDKSLVTKAAEPKYSLQILNKSGETVGNYDNFTGISERLLLKAGDYKLIATHGENESVGFETPFYMGEQQVTIEKAVTKNVSIVCTQANVKVTVEYSDLIKQGFTDYSLEVTNGEGKLFFEKEEERAGYLEVNDGTMNWTLTLNNGQEVFHLNKTITGVAPRQYYRFKFDIKENGSEDEGAFVPGITVDTTTDVFNWICEIVLKENLAKPEIKREDGIALSEPILVLEKARGANIKVNVASLAQIQDLKIMHRSGIVEEMGIPRSVTLTNISSELQVAVNNAGITWGNDPVLDAQQVSLDFSGIANRLPLGDYQFLMSVYDARCRLITDTLRINVIPDIDHIADEVNVMDVWAKFATVRGRWYTLERPAGLSLEYSTDQVNWKQAEKIDYFESSKTFIASLKGLDPGMTYYFRTTSDDKGASETVRQFMTESAIQIPNLNFDDWCKSGKSWYLGSSVDSKSWDSGNEGANSLGENNPTQPDETNIVAKAGNKAAARLETMVVASVMAAGNIYTGDFVKAIVNIFDFSKCGAELDFGIPYACRPTTMSGYYKYQPVAVTASRKSEVKVGDLDSCHIYIALFADWSGPFRVNTPESKFVDMRTAIAFGEVKASRTMTEYEPFTIHIQYRDKMRKPTYALIVATASKYGDYFTGGQGSKLWIDEFELGFDPVE